MELNDVFKARVSSYTKLSPAAVLESKSQSDGNLGTYPQGTDLSRRPSTSTKTTPEAVEQTSPAAHSQAYGKVDFSHDGLDTNARVANDGRVNIHINQKSRRFSDLLVPALRHQLNINHGLDPAAAPSKNDQQNLGKGSEDPTPPRMNVVIHVVGSRGDVQPFISLGKTLKDIYGHRVRLATHSTFRNFVEENGLEFFSIGGDPTELMAFMVKNPGLMPGFESLRAGDVGRRRKGMYEIIQGCWRSCIEAGDGTGAKASDDDLDNAARIDGTVFTDNDDSARTFIADAIIANPPSFAHIHCAEKLGVPLHLMFTMPWSPTQAFPHPLANVQSSNADSSITNFISYALVEMITWQGLGDLINRFREDSLGLEPVSLMWAPGMASRLRIPFTYCWSPALIPKPKDWGSHIDVSGFYFLSLADKYRPDPQLTAFLKAGPPPIYIGFGSIVVDDPDAMTKLIFEAVKKTGKRALISKGWGGLGTDALGAPTDVFMLGNVPHDWLFRYVSCVVHHGGAGTTAAGIAMSKPTVVVPFFGDQPFWGAMVAKSGAGPLPIPSKSLSSDNLANAIIEAHKPSVLERAQGLGASINSEKGTQMGARSFHDKLDVASLRCMLAANRVAAWRIKKTNIRLSPFAATTLINEGLLTIDDLKLYRPIEYETEDGPWDPISGGASALLGTLGNLAMGFADFPVEILRALRVKHSEESIIKTSSSSLLMSNSMQPVLYAPFTETSNLSDTTSKETDCGKAKKSEKIPHYNLATQAPETLVSRSLISSIDSSTSGRSCSGSQDGQISLDSALGAGKGIGRIVGAGLKSPMDFTLSLARGFHNAPKLYGDHSVRRVDKITGIQSGLKAAGKEFGLGLYDGVSGLFTQPFEGAKKEGFAGLIKGVGKGIGGIVLKPNAAIWGIPGYTFNGIYKELQKHFGSSVQNYIYAARLAQGFEDWKQSNDEERLEVIHRWSIERLKLSKVNRQTSRNSHHVPHAFSKNRPSASDDRTRAVKDRKKEHSTQAKPDCYGDSVAAGTPICYSQVYSSETLMNSDHAAFEAAIRASVSATSEGNIDQDQLIERALRASVLELRSAAKEGDTGDAVQRAINASVAEATRADGANIKNQLTPTPLVLNDHEAELNAALHQSIRLHDHLNFDTEDDDENIKHALEQLKLTSATKLPTREALDLQRALEESRKHHINKEKKLAKTKKKGDVVIEYGRE